MKTFRLEDLFSIVDSLLGRTPDDLELQSFLTALGNWPLPDFEEEEFTIYLEDKARGFCLLFEDCSAVRHPLASGKPEKMPIFIGCFFYAEGVDEYSMFKGTLPENIVWSDDSTSLVAKLGVPNNEIINKKTGRLMAHRWSVKQWLLTASYDSGGFLQELYLGIT